MLRENFEAPRSRPYLRSGVGIDVLALHRKPLQRVVGGGKHD